MVPPPPADIAGTAERPSDAADALGSLGGFGGLASVASTAKQVATYGNLLADAAKFTQKMQEDYPDDATRIAAYGDKMTEDADTIGVAALKIDAAQTCYEEAASALKAGIESGDVRSSDARRRQKEILGGVAKVQDVLDDSRVTMDTNMKSYNEALNTDTSGMGMNLGSIAQAASMAGVNLLSGGAGGGGSSQPYSVHAAANAAARQAASDAYVLQGGDPNAVDPTTGMMKGLMLATGVTTGTGIDRNDNVHRAYFVQSNAYTNAWWDAYGKSGGDRRRESTRRRLSDGILGCPG